MKFWAVEGNSQRLDGGAMFGNAPKELWQQWEPPDEKNRIALATRALLVEDEAGSTTLFEAGIGAFFDPKLRARYGVVEEEHRLLASLAALGFDERDIDAIVLSHLHFDHAGGLLSAYDGKAPRLLFPKARYYVGARHWERACAPHPRERASFIPQLNELLASSGRLVLVEKNRIDALSFPHTLHFVDGHTIGMMLAELSLSEGPLLFAGDLAPGRSWVHLPVTMGYDRFPELLVDEKRELFTRLAAGKGTLFFTHDPRVAFARLEKDEEGRFHSLLI